MKVTVIGPENSGYFEDLVPEGSLGDENLFWLGAIAGDGTACAVLGAGLYEDMAYIEWIYTDPEYREKGAARDLLRSLKTLLRKIDVRILQISFSEEDENLEEFLEDEGFFFDVDREKYLIPARDLIYSEMIDVYGEEHRTGARVVTPAGLGDPDAFFDYLAENEIPFGGENDDLSPSLVRVNEEGRIDGCMLIHRREDGDLEISYLKSSGLAGGAIDLFLGFRELVTGMDWQEANIIFTDRSGEMIKIIEEMARQDRDSYIITGEKNGLITL